MAAVYLVDASPPVYQIDYFPGKSKDEEDVKSKEYDIIIFASPYYKGMTQVKLEDFQNEMKPVENDFHLTVATFLEGSPNSSYFGIENLDDLPNALFSTNTDSFFNSFAKQKACSGKETAKPVYKMFSNKVPTEDQLKQVVPEWSDLRMANWMAYPEYDSSVEFPSFPLHEQVYHINAVELASSAMEMSVAAAKNVALLAYYRYTNQYDKIDEVFPNQATQEKTEL